MTPPTFAAGSEAAVAITAHTKRLASTRGTNWERQARARLRPHAHPAHVSAVKDVVKQCQGKFETLIVLGIGGSALGNIALQGALNPTAPGT